MKIDKFTIKNFKGVSLASIDLQSDAPGNVVTLIGLNESGKTTILEALSHFLSEDKSTKELVGTVTKKAAISDVIPKHRKAAFSGSVEIKAHLTVEEDDAKALAQHFLEKHNLILDAASVASKIQVTRTYVFQDSNLSTTNNLWALELGLKRPKEKTFKTYDGSGNSSDEAKELWVSGVLLLRERMPKVVYFPTFLFDFPERIYLKTDFSVVNNYYMQVIQDVLDSQSEGLSIEKHILQRIDKVKQDSKFATLFLSSFYQRDERKQVDAVLQKIANEIGKIVFGSWNQILGRNISGKRIHISLYFDPEKDNTPYLELGLVEGEDKYSLAERSLGFRWFFSFLLFTEFRKNRANNSTVFLFDEPAANLHSKAQMKLLESFDRIAREKTHIIYSTHSHYMVNPLWLEKAYIIENKANNYEDADDLTAFEARRSDIKATRYRTFLARHPNQITYFQPVLDALDVSLSPFIASSKALVIEGKYDFHAIHYLLKKHCDNSAVRIYPANGAGSLGPIVSIFRGWGVDFRILLDADRAGLDGRKKYRKDYLLAENEVFTLGDIAPELAGMTFEDIYKDDVRQAVKEKFTLEKIGKRDFSWFFQELVATASNAEFPDTEASFRPIMDWIQQTFQEN